MKFTANWKGVHEWLRMVLGDSDVTLLDIYMYMKQIFPSMISEYILNFFASQLFYCFFETCLVCSSAMKKHEVQKDFMKFWSSSGCLFSYYQCSYTYETFEHCVPIV